MFIKIVMRSYNSLFTINFSYLTDKTEVALCGFFYMFKLLFLLFFLFLTQAGYFPPIFEHTAFTRPHDLESIHPQEQIYLLHIPAKKKMKKVEPDFSLVAVVRCLFCDALF